jgi:protein ImuB
LDTIAREYSPRYERHSGDLVSVDVCGLERLFGSPRTIADDMRRDAASRGARVHVAIAGTRTAALVLAHAHPGVTVIMPGDEADALASLPLGVLEKCEVLSPKSEVLHTSDFGLQTLTVFRRWGLRTIGDLAKLPPDDLAARLGRAALVWQAIARGQDVRPLIPTLDEERFESTFELDWPVEELEPLSFVLTRLLEPLSTRLERRDRGAVVLHVLLRLVTKELYARRLELPTPMRDVRTLRTLALLDLESHPPSAAVDRVTIVIDPTPGRVVQHTLFSRALPTPEQLSTLLARLGAVMGQDRVGAPATVDTYRPGAFAMRPFKTEHGVEARGSRLEARQGLDSSLSPASSLQPLASALRRCRQAVPARVVIDRGRPVRLTTDRRGFAGGSIVRCAGPWRSSGDWWTREWGGPSESGKSGGESSVSSTHPVYPTHLTRQTYWNREEWDVALSDGAVYRIFQDRDTEGWFIDAIVD